MEHNQAGCVVVEMPSYIRKAEKLFSRAEMDELVTYLAANPAAGDLLQGTGGFRKVRWARSGEGKSGGARVIYIHRNENFPLFLFAVFAKNEKSSLSRAELSELKKASDILFAKYGVA